MNCLRCRIPRGQDVTCRECGFAYISPPPADDELAQQPAGYDPLAEVDGMPRYYSNSIFGNILLLVITGMNATGMAVVIVAVMVTMLVTSLLHPRPAWVFLTFGVVAFGFDVLSRRMLRCSLGDMKRGSEFMKMPVWILGSFIALLALMSMAVE